MINKKWCDPRNISSLSRSCSPHLEHLSIICRPFYLPREFSAVIVTAAYILHRQTPAWLCLNFTMCSAATLTNILTLLLSSQGILTSQPQAGHAELSPALSCPTRGPNTLDHCYSQFKNAYKPASLPAFGKSEHAAIFLTPEYKQRLAQEPPVKREVTRWSSHSEAMLQAALDDVDWDMFQGGAHLTSASSRM